MTSMAQALSAALLHFVWQGALVGILLWVALLILRNRPAALRYAVSCAALAVLAILPAVTAWTLYEPPAPLSTAPASLVAAGGTGGPVAGATPAPWLRGLEPWALPVWSFGVFLLSLRLLLSSLQVYRLRRRGEPAGDDILAAVEAIARRLRLIRPVRVLVASLADGPAVIGWLRPVILLPSAAVLGLTAQQLEAVLAHELAHIRRFDYLVNLLQMAIETLLFYHPAVWWTSSRIRHERELCCDDLAVASCGDALCYARALTRLERLRIATPAMALGSTGGPLAYRIQRLVGAGAGGFGPSKLSGIVALIVGLACFGLNIHWAHGQEKPAQPSAPDTTAILHSFVRHDADSVKVDTAGAPILHRTRIEYPHAAIEKRIEGTVAVEATLDAAGNVDDARVLSGPAELRKAALQSVLQWHFVTDAAGATRIVTLEFKLPAPGEQIAVAYTRSPEASQTLEIQERTSRMRDVEKQLAESRARQGGDAREQDLMRELERLRELASTLNSGQVILNAIRIEGLPEQLRHDLQARIPVRLGETLTREAMERINAAIRQVDEHLEPRFRPSGDGRSDLIIAAPR